MALVAEKGTPVAGEDRTGMVGAGCCTPSSSSSRPRGILSRLVPGRRKSRKLHSAAGAGAGSISGEGKSERR